jgi:protein-tyrosine phosphatase
VVSRDRLVPLEGALNCRDLGGYHTTDGRTVRWGHLYRSDGLHQLADADVETLAGLGLRTVIDLRNNVEIEMEPSRLAGHPTIERHHIGIGGEAADQAAAPLLEQVLSGGIEVFGVEDMAEMYAQMLDGAAADFGKVVTLVADPDRLPLLFHCTAGKDRTGVAAALVLEVLGVPDDTIVADYELTTTYRSGPRLEQLRPQLEAGGVDVDAVRPFLTAQADVMARTLAGLRERHGGAEAYLTTAAGVPPEALLRLRDALLEPGNP